MAIGSDFEQAVVTWCQFLSANKNLSDRTTDKYFKYLANLEKFLIDREHDHLTCTISDLEEFTGIFQLKAGVKPSSRKPIISAIRGFFGWICIKGYRSDNPAAELVTPKIGSPKKTDMRLHHAEKLLFAPDLDTFLGIRDAAVMATLMGCGLRVSGLCNLNDSDLIFDVDDNQHEILTLRVREKGNKERLVPAPDEVRLFIRAYLGHPELSSIIRQTDDGDMVLFVTTNNHSIAPHLYFGEARRISPDAVFNVVRKYGRMAGLPEKMLHPHAFRRLYGTRLAENDVTLMSMQALMGHAQPNSTAIYVRLATDKLRRDVDKGNPLRQMKTPVSALSKALSATKGKPL